MSLKTERFEMRVDEAVLARVDEWRSEQNDVPSRAEAIRRLVELALGRERGKVVKFSDGEKLIMMMIRDMHKQLQLKAGDVDPDFVAEVLSGGHYWAPKWDMSGLFHEHEDDPGHVRLVVDVLDMWSFIEASFKTLSKADKDRVKDAIGTLGTNPKFSGFDGNNEAEYMSITMFVVETMGRFTEFKGREMNSHMPMVNRYQRMVRVFEPMRAQLIGVGLTAAQVISLLEAKA